MTGWYYSLNDIFQDTYTLRILSSFIELIWLVGPYFILSVMINVVIRHYVAKKSIHLTTGHHFFDLILAALIGLFSPLPTYIAVPMGLSFLATGISFSVVTTFIIASPLMNIGIFYFTWSQMGIEIALARVLAALIIAVVGGFLSGLLFKKINSKLINNQSSSINGQRPLWLESWRSLRYFGKYFLFAVFISACVKALVSPDLITRLLGSNANTSLLAAIALGVPFYSCGGAAIPLVLQLSEMGMNKGAVLAFFIAGPSTKPETLYIFKTMFGGYQVVFFYLLYSVLAAFLSGFVFLNL